MKVTTPLLAAVSLLGSFFSTIQSVSGEVLAGPVNYPSLNASSAHSYYLLKPGTWKDSEQEAQKLGGHLVTVDSAEENQWILDTFGNFGGIPRRLWTGLSDVGVGGVFAWASHVPVNFTNWNEGQPDGLPGHGSVFLSPPGAVSPLLAGKWSATDDPETRTDGAIHAIVELPFRRTPQVRANIHTAGAQADAVVACDRAGNFVVVWDSWSQSGASEGIYARRFDAAGVPQGDEFRVDSDLAEKHIFPAVAMNANGSFVITWQTAAADESYFGIDARRFDRFGAAIGDVFRVNTTTTDFRGSPAVGVHSDGSFAVFWYARQVEDPSFGIFARFYGADGSPTSGESLVNTTTDRFQDFPAVAISAVDDRFAVAWYSDTGIYARIFDKYSNPIGSDFPVDSGTMAEPYLPSLCIKPDGSIVVTWSVSSTGGIYVRHFNSLGIPLAAEQKVDSTAGNYIGYAKIACDPNGNFVSTLR